MGDNTCNHDKVYNLRSAYTSFPPKRDWICRKCGARGLEPMESLLLPDSEYWQTVQKFREEHRHGTI